MLILTAVYVFLVSFQIHRRMWYDELITYYIAQQPTLHQMIGLVLKWDPSPPAIHLITRASIAIFGNHIVAGRLPSVIEFYVAGLALFLYTRRKVGDAYAAIPFLILCSNPLFFQYATEMRSYALLSMFFCLLLVSWDGATGSTEKRTLALGGVAISCLGLISSHVFAPFSVLPFLVAETVRSLRTRRIDYAVWAALLLPLVGVIGYLPLFRPYSHILFPPAFQASRKKIGIFFSDVTDVVTQGVLWATVLGLVASRIKWSPKRQRYGFRLPDAVLFTILLVNPILVISVMRYRHFAFWDRYCITSVLAIYILIALAMAWCLRLNKYAGWAATSLLACCILSHRPQLPLGGDPVHGNEPDYAAILAKTRPDLPLVAANGINFLPMDHDESPAIVSRLYLLLGGPAAIQYAHATIFEAFKELKYDFPIKAKVEDYPDFVREHHEFLVFGIPGYPEDWLLQKLTADGAKIIPIGDYRFPYPYVATTLFHVTLNGDDKSMTEKAKFAR